MVDDSQLLVSDMIIDSLFGLDILATFRTAYFDDELVSSGLSQWLSLKE